MHYCSKLVMCLFYLLPVEEIEIPNPDQAAVLKHTSKVGRCLAFHSVPFPSIVFEEGETGVL